ncbi:hypothetical protein [Paenibacillus sp. YIM B09110]|uniref:hypothetical protein n=1 Tax=Paenibacillus sp. YIM B09110 TaxID=3126102 RepID=UPI00301BB623
MRLQDSKRCILFIINWYEIVGGPRESTMQAETSIVQTEQSASQKFDLSKPWNFFDQTPTLNLSGTKEE